MALDLNRMITGESEAYPLSDFIRECADHLPYDVTFLHDIPEWGRSLEVPSEDMVEFVRLCILAHLEAGAIVVTKAEKGSPFAYRRVWEFGRNNRVIARMLIIYWRLAVKIAGEDEFMRDFRFSLGTEDTLKETPG